MRETKRLLISKPIIHFVNTKFKKETQRWTEEEIPIGISKIEDK